MALGFEQFRSLSDDEWIETVVRSVKEPVIDGVTFAGFPNDDLQAMIVGSSNEHAIREAGYFYKHVKAQYELATGAGLNGAMTLDFGIGWGRIARLFARDAGVGRIYGVDPVPLMVEVCRETRVPASISTTAAGGLLPFRDEMFDLTFAFSVFTHLPEKVALHWLGELHRVMKPGGVGVMTVEPPRFIDFCRSIGTGPELSMWHIFLRDKIAAMPDAEKRAARGEFVYIPTGGGPDLPPEVYGDAVIPRGYVKQKWTNKFDLLDYLDDPSSFWQAVVVLRRK